MIRVFSVLGLVCSLSLNGMEVKNYVCDLSADDVRIARRMARVDCGGSLSDTSDDEDSDAKEARLRAQAEELEAKKTKQSLRPSIRRHLSHSMENQIVTLQKINEPNDHK